MAAKIDRQLSCMTATRDQSTELGGRHSSHARSRFSQSSNHQAQDKPGHVSLLPLKNICRQPRQKTPSPAQSGWNGTQNTPKIKLLLPISQTGSRTSDQARWNVPIWNTAQPPCVFREEKRRT
jgi:hypothetical protein